MTPESCSIIKQIGGRFTLFNGVAGILLNFNEHAQTINEETKGAVNIYERYLSPELAETVINHTSSAMTPAITIGVGCVAVVALSDAGDKDHRALSIPPISGAVVYMGYECLQADFKPEKVDVGDCFSVMLGAAFAYAVYSKKMPWNKNFCRSNEVNTSIPVL